MGRVYASGQVFDDVWDAIAQTPAEAAVMRACSDLMDAIIKEVSSWEVTQREAAERLGIKQPRLNALLKQRIGLFSLDALVELAIRAGIKVDIVVGDDRRHAAATAKRPPKKTRLT